MKKSLWLLSILSVLLVAACDQEAKEATAEQPADNSADGFEYKVDQFADLAILRYQVPGFDQLSLNEKKLVYFLSQAALSGRDMIYDQNYRHNLRIRKTIETIVANYNGEKGEDWDRFMTYAKRVWFSNGIHHHYSTKKMIPSFPQEYLATLINGTEAEFPMMEGQDKAAFIEWLNPILFDATVDSKRVNQDESADIVAESANNYYGEGVTAEDVRAFYDAMGQSGPEKAPMYGLNSRLVKENGQLIEQTYKVGGLYSASIERIVFWLEQAVEVAENAEQKEALVKLVEYYKTGDLAVFDAYNIAWVKDVNSTVDVINGFIEVYGDAAGLRGAYESAVSIKDFEASKRMAALQSNVQWFEDNSPLMDEHKKKNVTGVSYKVINVVMEAGDAAPSTPIGINLPNSNWIRQDYGSKAVSLGNIKDAYSAASSGGTIDEFYLGDDVKARVKEYGILAGNMHTALHEVVGHASGQLEPGVPEPANTLKQYASPLEEGRADLVALYYLLDPKLVEIGVVPSLEVGKAEYDSYIMNGLMLQLRRLEEGEVIEEAHMRNRQLVAAWCYEKGAENNVIEKKIVDGKTYFVVNDYEALRELFGQLLREIQRIKSQGDFAAGKALIEDYAVQVDAQIWKEVKERFSHLSTSPYSGFIQPKLEPVMEGEEIVDVKISYPKDFTGQMMRYGTEYGFLPVEN